MLTPEFSTRLLVPDLGYLTDGYIWLKKWRKITRFNIALADFPQTLRLAQKGVIIKKLALNITKVIIQFVVLLLGFCTMGFCLLSKVLKKAWIRAEFSTFNI